MYAKLSYVFDQYLLKLPKIKKMETEDKFPTQMLMDLAFQDEGNKLYLKHRGLETYVRDELTRGFDKLRGKGEISVWLVFGSKVLIDMHDILGDDIKRGHQALLDTAASIKLKIPCRVEESLEVKALIIDGEQWNSKDDAIVMKMCHDIQPIKNDPVSRLKDMYLEDRPPAKRFWISIEKYTEIDAIKPSTIPSFINVSNPLFCGTRALELTLNMEQAGVILANQHQSIFLGAHL
jgi:hypothetical protein